MSVILGYQTENEIVLAADNRLSKSNGSIMSDTSPKIIIVNKYLAIAFSGNAAVQAMFQNFLDQSTDNENFNVEDILLRFETLYLSLRMNSEEYAKNILESSSCFIVAGKNKEKENVLYGISYVHGKLSHSQTKMILFPPADVEMQTCSTIFVKYYHTDFKHCMEKTIREISNSSNLVSPTGDIWYYDLSTENSQTKHF